MRRLKKYAALLLSMSLLVSLVGCAPAAPKSSTESVDATSGKDSTSGEDTTAGSDTAESTGAYKDVLNVAYNAQPATFDPHVTGATATREVDRMVYEGLFEEDKDGNPQPQLCESYEANEDNTEWTFKLRQGVKFQNGEEMKAKDVVASLNRWLDKNSIARKSIPTEYFEEVDDYTVKISLNEPCLLLPYVLANYAQFSAIMPASVIEAAGDENLTAEQIIGTGPYKFAEWSVDNYVKLELYDGYQPNTTESSGAWGDRTSTIPTIFIYFVVDTTTRLNGLETGEYDIVTSLAYTDIDRIKAMSDVTMLKENWNSITITMNKSSDSVLNDPRWRQIISYAMNADDIINGSFPTTGDDTISYPDACYFSKESQWYTDVSNLQYQDIDKAKALLDEIGYDGTPLVMMTTEAYPELYNATLILQQELEAIGVKVQLDVYDWGTMLTKISDTTAFDLYPMNYPASSNPVSVNYIMKTTASGFTNDPTLTSYVGQFQACPTKEEAIKFWNETIMPYCAEQVFILHLGTYDLLSGVSNKVEGYENYYGMKLWGLKVAE